MRIAYMLTSLGTGGAERQVVTLAERMKARGHEVMLIVLLPRQRREWATRIDTVRLDMAKSPLGVAAGISRGRRFLAAFQPDILHSHTFPANMTARMLRLAGASGKVVATIHNIYEGGWQRTIAYRVTDRLSIHTTAVSTAVADRFVRIRAVPRHKCSVLTNGVDTEAFTPPEHTRSLRRELMHAEDGFVWLAAGRDVPAKDFDNLLGAFKRVRTEMPKAQLWIAGALCERRFVRVNGQRVGPELCHSDSVRWLGPRDDLRQVMAAADAFVLSSAWEGMPLVVGEAMAMCKPVIATDVGGVRELVGDCGWMVPSRQPDALAAQMIRLMRLTEAERMTMGRSGRERICEKFDMKAKAEEWEALYTRLLNGAD